MLAFHNRLFGSRTPLASVAGGHSHFPQSAIRKKYVQLQELQHYKKN
jgi:hypothetical protein